MSLLYTRVSSSSQGDESLDIQNQICLQHINDKGILIDQCFHEVSSAYKGPQNKLNHILDNFKDCALYILNVSRFSRNIVNGIRMLQKAKESKKAESRKSHKGIILVNHA